MSQYCREPMHTHRPMQPTSRAYWHWRVPGIIVFSRNNARDCICFPIVRYSSSDTRLLTNGIFGVDVTQAKSCRRGLNDYDIPNISMSGQPAGS